MKLTKEDVQHTAVLSKLKFDDAGEEALAKDLSDILDYFVKINELDTENIMPLTHVLENENVFRADEVTPGLTIGEVLQNAPDEEGRTFKVPKML